MKWRPAKKQAVITNRIATAIEVRFIPIEVNIRTTLTFLPDELVLAEQTVQPRQTDLRFILDPVEESRVVSRSLAQ